MYDDLMGCYVIPGLQKGTHILKGTQDNIILLQELYFLKVNISSFEVPFFDNCVKQLAENKKFWHSYMNNMFFFFN